MKIRELKHTCGSAIASAWPPSWATSGGGPWPIGSQGMIVRAEWSADRRSLRIVNHHEGQDHTGLFIVDDPETTLPKVLKVFNERVPLSVDEAGVLDLPD